VPQPGPSGPLLQTDGAATLLANDTRSSTVSAKLNAPALNRHSRQELFSAGPDLILLRGQPHAPIRPLLGTCDPCAGYGGPGHYYALREFTGLADATHSSWMDREPFRVDSAQAREKSFGMPAAR